MPHVVQAKGARFDADFLGHHEGGIKPHAELADKIDLLAVGLGKLAEKGLGAGMGNGAQVGLQLAPVHADAGMGDGEGVCLFVKLDPDLQRHMAVENLLFHHALVAEFFQGIRGVGDQFAQEDLLFRVERMDYDVEHLFYFGLKFLGLCLGGHFFGTHFFLS